MTISEDADLPLVLIVDDNPDMSLLVSRMLGATFRVEVAADGETGLAQARAVRPDLIVTDVIMPGLPGDKLVAAVRGDAELRGTPVLAMSGRGDDAMRVAVLRAGANDYLVKPFSAEELRARATNLVAFRRAEAKLRVLESVLERDRISGQVQELVIHRLSSLSMALTALAGRLRRDLGSEELASLNDAVDEIDRIITDIRSTIYEGQ
jgi:DNA-binding response OmpR family regulator